MGAMLAMLRIFAGAFLLHSGMGKIAWLSSNQLGPMLKGVAAAGGGGPLAFYMRFLAQSAIPHASQLSWLVVVGEIGLGSLLLLGLFTRAAALLALFMNANYLLAFWGAGAATQGINLAFVLMEFTFLVVGAGRVCGIDARLAAKHPRWILW